MVPTLLDYMYLTSGKFQSDHVTFCIQERVEGLLLTERPSRSMFFVSTSFLGDGIAIQRGAPRQLHFSADNLDSMLAMLWLCVCVHVHEDSLLSLHFKLQPNSEAQRLNLTNQCGCRVMCLCFCHAITQLTETHHLMREAFIGISPCTRTCSYKAKVLCYKWDAVILCLGYKVSSWFQYTNTFTPKDYKDCFAAQTLRVVTQVVTAKRVVLFTSFMLLD